jgi:hypothetical protein
MTNKTFIVIKAQIRHRAGYEFEINGQPNDNDLRFKTLEEAKDYIKNLKPEKKENEVPLIIVEEILNVYDKKLVYIKQ